MPKGQSLYHKYPDYRVDLEPGGQLRIAELPDLCRRRSRTACSSESVANFG